MRSRRRSAAILDAELATTAATTADKDWPLAADVYAEQHDEFWERLHDAERLSAAALMSVGPDGASRRARALCAVRSVTTPTREVGLLTAEGASDGRVEVVPPCCDLAVGDFEDTHDRHRYLDTVLTA
jgi:hypothetical protein